MCISSALEALAQFVQANCGRSYARVLILLVIRTYCSLATSRCEMHYITGKSYIRGVNRMLIKFNKIINGTSADVKKSSAEVNLADDLR